MAKRSKREFNLFDDPTGEEKRNSDMGYLESMDNAVNNTKDKPKKDYVRRTFIIHPNDLKILQQVVHKVKSTGQYTYTQKEGLHEAIALLAKSKGVE